MMMIATFIAHDSINLSTECAGGVRGVERGGGGRGESRESHNN